jgi:hypothetical protein
MGDLCHRVYSNRALDTKCELVDGRCGFWILFWPIYHGWAIVGVWLGASLHRLRSSSKPNCHQRVLDILVPVPLRAKEAADVVHDYSLYHLQLCLSDAGYRVCYPLAEFEVIWPTIERGVDWEHLYLGGVRIYPDWCRTSAANVRLLVT